MSVRIAIGIILLVFAYPACEAVRTQPDTDVLTAVAFAVSYMVLATYLIITGLELPDDWQAMGRKTE